MSTIQGYILQCDFKTAGGGRCRWAEVERLGKRFFLKEFLAPKFPIEGSPGSIKTKELKLEACKKFEQRHRYLAKTIGERVADGGNLVKTVDFFRNDATYFKVTDWVDISTINPESSSLLPLKKRLEILKTLTHSLQLLHNLNIVHGDLKPANILIKETSSGYLAAKLIDFDDSYESGKPPENDEIVGDQMYYSPELLSYVTLPEDSDLATKQVHKLNLTLSSDVFSLGLLFHEYLVGSLPLTESSRYACEAALRRETIKISDKVHPRVKTLIQQMLADIPEKRPTTSKIFETLKSELTDSPTPHADTTGRLTIKVGSPEVRISTIESKTTETANPSTTSSKLRINMAKRS